MLSEMTAEQFLEWQRFDAKHPFGDRRLEVEFALLRRAITAVVAGDQTPDLPQFLWSYLVSEADQEVLKERALEERIKRAFGI